MQYGVDLATPGIPHISAQPLQSIALSLPIDNIPKKTQPINEAASLTPASSHAVVTCYNLILQTLKSNRPCSPTGTKQTTQAKTSPTALRLHEYVSTALFHPALTSPNTNRLKSNSSCAPAFRLISHSYNQHAPRGKETFIDRFFIFVPATGIAVFFPELSFLLLISVPPFPGIPERAK